MNPVLSAIEALHLVLESRHFQNLKWATSSLALLVGLPPLPKLPLSQQIRSCPLRSPSANYLALLGSARFPSSSGSPESRFSPSLPPALSVSITALPSSPAWCLLLQLPLAVPLQSSLHRVVLAERRSDDSLSLRLLRFRSPYRHYLAELCGFLVRVFSAFCLDCELTVSTQVCSQLLTLCESVFLPGLILSHLGNSCYWFSMWRKVKDCGPFSSSCVWIIFWWVSGEPAVLIPHTEAMAYVRASLLPFSGLIFSSTRDILRWEKKSCTQCSCCGQRTDL